MLSELPMKQANAVGPEAQLIGLDLLASSVLLLHANGDIAHANAAAESLFGLSRRQLAGQNICALFIEAEALAASLGEAAQDYFAQKAQPLTVSRLALEPLDVHSVLVVLHGQMWPLLLELREVEHSRRLERAIDSLEHADANRELLRNLAHEIRNPLGGLRGAAQLLQDELPDPRLAEYTQVIIAEADRLHVLVDRLLAPQRMQRQDAPLNIHEVCERVGALIMAEYGAGLNWVRDYDISVPELIADRAQLIQVLLNIARNAAQALSVRRQAGTAEIIIRTRVARQMTLGGHRYPLALVVSVIDNGPGIPESIRDRVFHPLVTGHDQGTGLGLSLAQSLVQQHGGVLTCESRRGHTEFQIRLPLHRARHSGITP